MADKSEIGESSKQKNVPGDCSKCGKKGKYIRSTIFEKLFHYCPKCTYNAAFGVSPILSN